ncbi:hypothetical protein JCM10207_008709 [Rhodosporidiobolus poonsookiae]
MASAADVELLELLRSIPPLLDPDLPSPPPSPSPVPASPVKRSHEELQKTARAEEQSRAKPVGLGLEGTEDRGAEVDREPKRARPAPPPPPPAPSSISSSRQPPPPPPPPALIAQPPTPELRGSPALSTPRLPSGGMGGKAGTSRADREEWRKDWPKERLRKLAASCRDLARTLKHKGDAFSRPPSSGADGGPAPSRPTRKDYLRGIVHQMDAILLYAFAFWCDDAAGKTCLTANWQSVFGLIGFVRKVAEKDPGAGLIVGLCARMEAVAVYTLSMHEQKALNYKGMHLSQTLSSSTPSSGSSARPGPPPPPLHPGDHIPSPSSNTTDSPAAASPSAHPPASSTPSSGPDPKAYSDFLKSFLRASPDLFRCQRLYDDSCASLGPSVLSTAFPRTWAACVAPVTFDHPDVGSFVLPCKPWRFAWPAELGRGTMGHQVAFCRMVLEEWSEREGLGWEAPSVGEGI